MSYDIRRINIVYNSSYPISVFKLNFDYCEHNLTLFFNSEDEFFKLNLNPSLRIMEHFQNYELYNISYEYDQRSLSASDYTDEVYYAYPPTFFTSVCYMTGTKNSTPSSSTIFNSNFRDKFLNDFHLSMADQKLNCISDNSSKIISKKTFEYLKSVCNITYNLSIFSEDYNGFEGFIDRHTYITCTYEYKQDKYFLNSFFSNNEKVYSEIIRNLEFLPKQAQISWITSVTQNGLQIEELPVEVPKPIFNSFYPWLNGHDLDSFLDNYLNSNESILLLYGDPGTGKSNLLKHFLHKYNLSALITYQDNIRDLDSMFSHFLKGDDRVLIIEDADEFLVKREAGNTSMKRLLNITDGLTSNKDKKVIFTTNLTNTNNIDSALLRDGRCYGSFRFEPLNKQQSLLVATDIEIDHSLLTKNSYTLAELFTIKNNKLKLIKSSQASSFGFSN